MSALRWLLAVAVLVACTDRVDAPPYTGEPIVRDSAGITVVENPAGVRMLGLRETLGIGEVDGRHHDVGDGTVLARQRFEAFFLALLPGGRVAAYREEGIGIPRVAIMSLTLVEP